MSTKEACKNWILAIVMSLFPFSLHAQDFSAKLEEGLSAQELGDFNSAIAIFQPLAEQGYAPAQYFLGMMHYNGRGVPENKIRALMWVWLSHYNGYYRSQVKVQIISGYMNESEIRRAEEAIDECLQSNYVNCY